MVLSQEKKQPEGHTRPLLKHGKPPPPPPPGHKGRYLPKKTNEGFSGSNNQKH